MKIMEKFWHICELEEDVVSFSEFSVAAVPEIWTVQLQDGSFICYWPKENASKKIRSFADPKEGGNWKTYKCRILMSGEKYSRYEEAREAEKIAQEVSCMTPENTRMLNSTMDFDVSDVEEIEDVDESSEDKEHFKGRSAFVHDCNSTMDFDVDVEESDDSMVGNDTTEFNKAALMGGSYSSKKMVDVAAVADKNYDSSDDRDWFELKRADELSRSPSYGSVESGYSHHFGLNNDFLTSTAISDTSVLTNSETIMSSIKALELNISSLFQNIKNDLDEIKKSLGNATKDEAQTNQYFMRTRMNNQAIDEIILIGEDDVSGESSTKHEDQTNKNSVPILTSNQSIDDIIFIDVSHENNPRVHNQILVRDEMSDEDMPELFPPRSPLSSIHVQENLNGLINNETFDLNLPKNLKMEVVDKIEFGANEDILELDENMEKKLVKDLLPRHKEEEAAYMKRTVDILFENNFFLDSITWKPEKKRQCIKHTNTLKCWKESFATVFGPDEKNKRFMTHFRRLKSAKRAAAKAEEKRKSCSNKKSALNSAKK